MNKVVHCKREAYDVYIGRPSKWGNLYSHKKDTMAQYEVSTVEEAIEKYREWLPQQKELMDCILDELDNKILGCWCKIKGNEPCHGDVLVEMINKLKSEAI